MKKLLSILMLLLLVTVVFTSACGDDDDDDDDNDDTGDDDDDDDDDDDNDDTGDDDTGDDDTGDDDDDDTGDDDTGDDDDDTGDDDDDTGDDDTGDDDDDDTGDDDDDDDTGSEGDFTATMDVNPICVLSCIVTWTTDEPATSWVEFGEAASGFTHRIGTDDLTTNHEVIVVGMHEDQSYALQAVSDTSTKEELRSQELSFSTGDLPEHWMEATLDVYEENLVNEGWTITNLASGSMSTSLTGAIYDMSGEVIWYYEHSGGNGRMDTVFSWIDGQYVLVGPGVPEGEHPFKMDLAGNVVWEGPEQTGTGMNDDGAMHHVFQQLGNGDYVTTINDIRSNITGDEIQRFDSDLNTIWSWNAWDHLTPQAGPGGAWTHVNSVSFDDANSVAYISSYTLGLVFKVNTNTSNIIWSFGIDGDFSADPGADVPWFSGSHGIDYLGNGQLIMYDNGNVMRGYSRAVLYELDESTMSSEILWDYNGDSTSDQWYNMSVGDADLLDNGNVLITAGNGAQNQSPTRFIEVTPDGVKVWQLWLYYESDRKVASFQAERIPALAESIE